MELYKNVEGEIEVLTEKRAGSDEFYSEQWALFGSTILMRETHEDFWKRFSKNETGIEIQSQDPLWGFCGLMETPHTKRHHGQIQIFGRIWDQRPANTQGEWVNFTRIAELPFVGSEKQALLLALSVLMEGKAPSYIEYLGDT